MSQIEQHPTGSSTTLKHDEGYVTETSAGYATDTSTDYCPTTGTDICLDQKPLDKSVSFAEVDEATGLLKQDQEKEREENALLLEYLECERKVDSGFGSSPDLTNIDLDEYLHDDDKTKPKILLRVSI